MLINNTESSNIPFNNKVLSKYQRRKNIKDNMQGIDQHLGYSIIQRRENWIKSLDRKKTKQKKQHMRMHP